MRKLRRIQIVAALFLGLFMAATVSAACNQQLAVQCRQTYTRCVIDTGGDPDGDCEVQYNQCLLSAGCEIP